MAQSFNAVDIGQLDEANVAVSKEVKLVMHPPKTLKRQGNVDMFTPFIV